MTVAEQAKQILDLSKLNLPESPKIVGVDVEEFVAHDGDDALWVYVFLDEATRDSELQGGAGLQIRNEIHEKLFSHGLKEFPYTRILKKSELEEVMNDDEDLHVS